MTFGAEPMPRHHSIPVPEVFDPGFRLQPFVSMQQAVG